MTSVQVINLGINDQLRLMAQGLESLNSKEMPCTLMVIHLLGMVCSFKIMAVSKHKDDPIFTMQEGHCAIDILHLRTDFQINKILLMFNSI